MVDWEAVSTALAPLALDYGARLLGVLVLLFAAWVIAGWVRRVVRTTLERAQFDATLTSFFASSSRWLILTLAILACLGIFGVETTSFAAVIGATGLAIGLAFQGTLSNFASGVMLLVFRPFKVADVVTIAGQTGKIDAIDLFSTTLDTFDNRRFVVPNGSIYGSVIENISFHPTRRIEVTVGVDYTADIDQTREVLSTAVAGTEGVLADPEPGVALLALGPSSVDWAVRVWANAGDFGAVKDRTIRAVKRALDDAGIGIPFPQMDVHLDQGGGD